MLTPDAVKSKQFQATGRGAYRADDVDGFFAEVSASYEQMFKENGELIKKISLLANKVEKYKDEEDSLRKALISAQTLADKIVKDAKDSIAGTLENANEDADKIRAAAEDEAKEIVAKAKAEADAVLLQSKKDADEILGAVNRKVMKESLEFEMLQKKAAEFRAHLLGLYKEHLNLINAIPEYVAEEMPQEEAATETAPETAAPAEETPAEAPAPAEVPAEAPAAEEAPAVVEIPVVEETAAFEKYEDISSSTEPEAEEETAGEPAEEGFSLDLSAFEEDEEEDEAEPAAEAPAEEAPARAYATIEDEDNASDDDDDDEPVSFKSFFKKK
ncbi:MAG: DivIVA domain-containing protein [Clostridia bacterium]|nr:DivIVA domain-containing protein [Clostridia bacterium]